MPFGEALSLHVKTLIPVGIQSLLDDTGRVRLFRIDGDYSEWVRKSEYITLGKTIRSDDWFMKKGKSV